MFGLRINMLAMVVVSCWPVSYLVASSAARRQRIGSPAAGAVGRGGKRCGRGPAGPPAGKIGLGAASEQVYRRQTSRISQALPRPVLGRGAEPSAAAA